MAHGPRARNLQRGQELAADSQLAQPLARQMQSFYRMKLEKAQAPVAHGLLSLKSGQDGKYECVDPEVGKMRITSHNVPLAETAQTTLGKLDAELTASLSDPDRKVVRTALEQVGNLGSVRSTQAIRDIAIFGDPEFQGLARAALLRLGDYSLWDRAIEFATQPVQNIEVRHVQFGVVEAVIDIRDPSMVPALNSLLASPLVSLRRGAAKALRGISDPSSARFLVRSLDDSDPDIQYDAVMALAALPGASPSNAPARDIFDQEPAKYLG
jgi:HEAT repeat protein